MKQRTQYCNHSNFGIYKNHVVLKKQENECNRVISTGGYFESVDIVVNDDMIKTLDTRLKLERVMIG